MTRRRRKSFSVRKRTYGIANAAETRRTTGSIHPPSCRFPTKRSMYESTHITTQTHTYTYTHTHARMHAHRHTDILAETRVFLPLRISPLLSRFFNPCCRSSCRHRPLKRVWLISDLYYFYFMNMWYVHMMMFVFPYTRRIIYFIASAVVMVIVGGGWVTAVGTRTGTVFGFHVNVINYCVSVNWKCLLKISYLF